jgi:hypothetical protein
MFVKSRNPVKLFRVTVGILGTGETAVNCRENSVKLSFFFVKDVCFESVVSDAKIEQIKKRNLQPTVTSELVSSALVWEV